MLHQRTLVPLVAAVAVSVSGAAAPAPVVARAAGDRGSSAQPPHSRAAVPPTTARDFIQRTDAALLGHLVRTSTADWIKATYINDDTDRNAAALLDDQLAFMGRAVREARAFSGDGLDAQTSRMFSLLRTSQALVAPEEAARRSELAAIANRLDSAYGKGKWCEERCRPGDKKCGGTGADGQAVPPKCLSLQQLSEQLRAGATPADRLMAWLRWHEVSKPMRSDFVRFVELANEGAREHGFSDLGDRWRSVYDMPSADFEREVERLWQQVKPLYEALHCHARARLSAKYGEAVVPSRGPIPAHLFGNMWAQEWSALFPDVAPAPGAARLDVTSGLRRKRVDAKGLVRMGEAFFTSMGLPPLPGTFWERSQFTAPRDREVACHASAWDVTYSNDLRIKMCIKIDEEDLQTVHHELGHIYYYMAYHTLPALLQQGAHDGFHEAIGDAIALSITPDYLSRLGLVGAPPKGDHELLNVQMKMALEKVAFLPFGRLIDQWRWDVFSGRTKPGDYNARWWALRREYQGVSAPGGTRPEDAFDPGAKFHVPANVPYVRYFLAHILQFQFHRALCKAAGHTGPLHTCSIDGSAEAGRRLWATLQLGASRPWPDAMEALTGERRMDASALLEYFEPLRGWLATQNAGRACGW